MRKHLKKIERYIPIIAVKERDLQEQVSALRELQDRKASTQEKLHRQQEKYITGVEYLNQKRSHGKIDELLYLETCLDKVKGDWYQELQSLKDLEVEELRQQTMVLGIKQEIASLEALQKRYQTQHDHEEAQISQKQMDEFAANAYMRGKKESSR